MALKFAPQFNFIVLLQKFYLLIGIFQRKFPEYVLTELQRLQENSKTFKLSWKTYIFPSSLKVTLNFPKNIC